MQRARQRLMQFKSYALFPLLLGACLLQLGIVANVNLIVSTVLVVLLSALTFWLAGSVVTRRARIVLAAALTVNLLLLLLYGWTVDERVHIRVRVDSSQGRFTATVDTKPARRPPAVWQWDVEERAQPASGGVGLWVADRATGGHKFWRYPAYVLGNLADLIDSTALQPAWDNVVVRDNATGKVLWQGTFDGQQADGWRAGSGTWSINERGEYGPRNGGWSFVGANDWTNYTVEADILRARNVVGMAVLLQNDSLPTGAFLLVGPQYEVWRWGTWDTSTYQLRGPYDGFMKPWQAHLQETVASYLKNWQYAVLCALLLALATTSLRLVSPLFVRILRLPLRRRSQALAISDDVAAAATTPTAVLRGRLRSVRLPKGQRAFHLALGTLALLTVIATSAICLIQLEGIPHVQDSVSYSFQAKILARGQWYVAEPPNYDAFEFQYVARHNGKWFSIYQPGYALLLAVGTLANLPWLVNPLLGGGGLFLLGLVGARLFGRGVGLLAVLLGMLSPFVLQLTSSFMAHASGFFWMALTLYTLVRMEQQPDERGIARWLVPLGAGVSAAWAFITRPYTAVLLVAPFAIYFLLVLWRRPAWWRWLWAIVGAVPVLSLMLHFNYVVMGDPLKNTWTLDGPTNRLGFALTGIGMRNGHTLRDGIYNTTVNTFELLRHLYGWPLYLTLAFVMLPFALGAARRWSWLLLVSAAALILGYAAYWAPGVMYGPRYYYETTPALLLLSAHGLAVATRRANQVATLIVKRQQPATLGYVPAAVLLLALLINNASSYLPEQIALLRGYNFTSADRIRAVERAGLHNALVFVEGSQVGWFTYGSVFSRNDPWLRGDVVYARDLGEARNRVTATQFPGRSLYYITKNIQLVRLDYSLPVDAATTPQPTAP